MKKGCCLFLPVVLLLFLCGCRFPSFDIRNLPLIKQFECDLSVNADGREYYCHFIRDNDRAEISVISPEKINGLTLVYENDVYSVGFRGVTLTLDDRENKYVRNFADGFITSLEETFSLEENKPRYENGRVIYDGSGEYGEFVLSFDTEGRLLSMEIPSVNTIITVENFQF